jgi:hypothetical protein
MGDAHMIADYATRLGVTREAAVAAFEKCWTLQDALDRAWRQINYSSNMIFWADKRSGLWDHSNGFIDEGMVLSGKRIVAVHEGMKDLWIFANRDGPIYLYSGPEIFECRQPSAR